MILGRIVNCSNNQEALMQEKEDPNNNLMTKAMLYGSLKAASAFIGYPFSTVRSIYYNTTEKNIFGITLEIFKNEGLRGFYKRGFGPTCLQMGAKEVYRGGVYEALGHGTAAVIINSALDTLTMPLDLIRTRQQTVAQKSTADVIKEITANGAKNAFKLSYQGSGFYFSRQLGAHLLSVYFQKGSDYTISKSFYNGEKVPFVPGFAGALVAGCCVAAILNPFNLALTKFQANLLCGQTTSPYNILQKIAAEEGARGLVKGSSIGFFFAILGQLTYYTSKRLCEEMPKKQSFAEIEVEKEIVKSFNKSSGSQCRE
jgi:hypothetical protein